MLRTTEYNMYKDIKESISSLTNDLNDFLYDLMEKEVLEKENKNINDLYNSTSIDWQLTHLRFKISCLKYKYGELKVQDYRQKVKNRDLDNERWNFISEIKEISRAILKKDYTCYEDHLPRDKSEYLIYLDYKGFKDLLHIPSNKKGSKYLSLTELKRKDEKGFTHKVYGKLDNDPYSELELCFSKENLSRLESIFKIYPDLGFFILVGEPICEEKARVQAKYVAYIMDKPINKEEKDNHLFKGIIAVGFDAIDYNL